MSCCLGFGFAKGEYSRRLWVAGISGCSICKRSFKPNGVENTKGKDGGRASKVPKKALAREKPKTA